MATVEVLESFGLPDTFPAFLVPEKGQRFVQACAKGMPKDALLRAARRAGFNPLWKRLEHMDEGVYGFGLTINGMVVPFMVRMKVTTVAPAAPAPTQDTLF